MLLFHKIITGDYEFDDDPWKNISSSAKELIQGLLLVDPKQRTTISQALNSPFIQMYQKAYT